MSLQFRSTLMGALALALLLLLPPSSAFASSALEVTPEKTIYLPGELLVIRGSVPEVDPLEEVALRVLMPNGRLWGVGQVAPSEEGDFSITLGRFKEDDPLGLYRILVAYKGESNEAILYLGVEAEHVITFNGGEWVVRSVASGKVSSVELNQPAKSLIVSFTSYAEGFLMLFIPQELLGGPYSLMLDGSIAEAKIGGDEVIAQIFLEVGEGSHTIQVTGAKVIPEFPTSLLPLLLGMVAAAFLPWLRRRGFEEAL